MPKRSLNPGKDAPKNVELLNQAIDKMLSTQNHQPGGGVKVSKSDSGVEPLLRIAAELRNLPNANFKARLKSKLEGKKTMSTVAEPVAAVRTTASPNLSFKDAAKAIEFYKTALGAKELFRFEAGGSVPHAEIAIGDSVITLSDEWPQGGRFSAETLGASSVQMNVRVADVDSFAENAIRAGLEVKRPIQDQFYGSRDVLLADPFGYTWRVYTVKEEMSVDEMHRRMERLTHGPEGGAMPGKSAPAIPRGLRMVTPYLVAEDGEALIDFVKQAFDAEETLRAVMPTGVHGEVKLGDSTLMLGGGIKGRKFPGTFQPNALHVYVEDADVTYAKALAAGAVSIDEPRDQEYGERSATVKDSAGNYWYIATYQGKGLVPEGLHNVNPYLHPLRAEPLISFLKRGFGAEEVARYASPDGVVHHAVVRIGDSVVEMGEAHGKYAPMEAMFYVFVPDMDAVYRRAIAAGATSFQEPTDQPYGDRNAGVKDAFGNKWYIATHVKDVI
jgi:PhnB protein